MSFVYTTTTYTLQLEATCCMLSSSSPHSPPLLLRPSSRRRSGPSLFSAREKRLTRGSARSLPWRPPAVMQLPPPPKRCALFVLRGGWRHRHDGPNRPGHHHPTMNIHNSYLMYHGHATRIPTCCPSSCITGPPPHKQRVAERTEEYSRNVDPEGSRFERKMEDYKERETPEFVQSHLTKER